MNKVLLLSLFICNMKKLLLTLLFLPIMVCAQNTTNYKEINIGFPPGASFLWGQTIYFNNNTLLDYQGGIAFPSIGTAKVGYGISDDNFAAVLGVRLFLNCLTNFKNTFTVLLGVLLFLLHTLLQTTHIQPVVLYSK